jgi:C4-dicarboxylate transporter, DctM subunit
MNGTVVGIILTVIMLVLLLWGTQVGWTLVAIGFIGYALLGGLGAAIGNLAIIPFNTMNSYNFAVIPLFLLMSEFVGQSAMGRETYETARAWLGQFRGGLAMATVAACGLFACVSGSSLAGTIVMGRVAYPEMKRLGYSDQLATGVTAAGGTLGILIPPSMGFVLIGILADLSIGKLFLAGILPGITVIVFYIATITILCRVNPKLAPALTKTSGREKVTSIKKTWPVALLFLLMMGGIYGGVFTATEAAGIGAFGALVIAFARRQMTGELFWDCLKDTSKMAAMMIIMVVGAFTFNAFLAITQIPATLGDAMVNLPFSRWVTLGVVIIFYLICGMFFDIYAILILTIPILYPAIKALGFDLIWYSVLMVRVVEVGFITPPFGINVFGLAGVIKVPLGVMYRGVVPFCISDCLNIILLAAFPAISTFIPSLM